MNFKTTYILFGILGAVLIVFAVVLMVGPTGKAASDYILPSMHDPAHRVAANDIDTVEIDRFRPRKETLVFVRDPETGGWKMTQPYDLRADASNIDQVI